MATKEKQPFSGMPGEHFLTEAQLLINKDRFTCNRDRQMTRGSSEREAIFVAGSEDEVKAFSGYKSHVAALLATHSRKAAVLSDPRFVRSSFGTHILGATKIRANRHHQFPREIQSFPLYTVGAFLQNLV